MAKGKKTGGRIKGTPNEVTKELRERVSSFLSDNWSLIESDFKQLEPKDRLIFYERLMSYGLPKLNSVDITQNNTGVKQIIVERVSNKTGATEGKVSQMVSQT